MAQRSADGHLALSPLGGNTRGGCTRGAGGSDLVFRLLQLVEEPPDVFQQRVARRFGGVAETLLQRPDGVLHEVARRLQAAQPQLGRQIVELGAVAGLTVLVDELEGERPGLVDALDRRAFEFAAALEVGARLLHLLAVEERFRHRIDVVGHGPIMPRKKARASAGGGGAGLLLADSPRIGPSLTGSAGAPRSNKSSCLSGGWSPLRTGRRPSPRRAHSFPIWRLLVDRKAGRPL